MTAITHPIIEVAKKDLGKKEKPGNSGFFDRELEVDMLNVGWQRGWAWCACILEKWIWQAYPDRKEKLKGLFVPSAVNTFRNLVNAGYEKSDVPVVGSLVFWQKYEDGKAIWTGHCGIVIEVYSEIQFKTIEGNTSNTGSRNGDGVYSLLRTVKKEVTDGLKVIGFIKV
jgi:hypothetical protein